MKSILFVCLGNICRSPAAEGVMISLLRQHKITDFKIDSAGTSAYHEGEMADPRMQDHARRRGYELRSLSRRFDPTDDFKNFDLILTMDDSNYQNVISLAADEGQKSKVQKFTSWCKIHDINYVPDPYAKGAEGFEQVMDIIEDGCQQILNTINKSRYY